MHSRPGPPLPQYATQVDYTGACNAWDTSLGRLLQMPGAHHSQEAEHCKASRLRKSAFMKGHGNLMPLDESMCTAAAAVSRAMQAWSDACHGVLHLSDTMSCALASIAMQNLVLQSL
eukprot:317685-Pelagomonas_calceolata.AAC.1